MQITQLDPNFSVSAQIQAADIAEIAAAGFTALINNRPDGEAPDQPKSAEIEAEAKRHNLRYWYIPIVPGGMTDADARRLVATLSGVEGPVLAYCRTGTRSTNLWKAAQQIS